jgi:hypothetical protein
MRNAAYLDYLEKKEKQIIFSIRNIKIFHGHISSFFRVLKGLVLGFGLGNLLILNSRQHGLVTYLFLFLLFFCLAVVFIHYERRKYNRKGLKNSMKIALLIFGCSFFISLFVLLYSNDFIIVLITTMFFASLAYSLE